MKLRIALKVIRAKGPMIGNFLGAPIYGWRHRCDTRVRAGRRYRRWMRSVLRAERAAQ